MPSLTSHSYGGAAPHRSVAFGAADGPSTAVDAAHPLPTSERGYQGAIAIVPGIAQPPQRAVAIVCAAAGTMVLQLADGSTIAVPVSAGLAILPMAVATVIVAGTTATATCYNLV